jgi:tetratricopeptide (TPR) repeat protein
VAELAQVLAVVNQQRAQGPVTTRICVIAGKPGAGKSALAIRAAHALKPLFADVQLYVDLRGADDEPRPPEAVLAGFLRDLGVADEVLPPDLPGRAALFRSLLSDRRAVIVLDNARDEAQLRPLLPAGADCAVLITSRPRLASLPSADLINLTEQSLDAAVDLLARLAGADRIFPENEAAMQIVELCGGLPLALRIAAATLKAKPHWSVARLVDRLQDERRRLDLLRAGDLDVRASFELSYRGLTTAQARAFRLLGLLPGPDFSIEVVAAMLACDQVEAEDLLEELQEAQLVDPVGDRRYRLHDLLRAFARERLATEEGDHDRASAQERVLAWYLDTARVTADKLPHDLHQGTGGSRGEDPAEAVTQQSALDWFEAERLSLVPAVARAVAVHRWEVAIGIAHALIGFFAMRAFWGDEQRTQELALESARQLGDQHGAGRILVNLGRVYAKQGNWPGASDCFDEARRILAGLGDRDNEGQALIGQGTVLWHQARWDDAIACFDQALSLFRELGDGDREGEALIGLGAVYCYQTRWHDAIVAYEQSLAAVRRVGNGHREGEALSGLGTVYREMGRRQEADDCQEQSRSLFTRLGDRFREAEATHALANVRRDQGRWEEARSLYLRALAIRRDLGNRPGDGWSLAQLGHLGRDQGQWQDALGWYEQALEIFRQLGNRDGEGWTLAGMGVAHLNLDDVDLARSSMEQGLAIHREVGDRQGEARGLVQLVAVLLRLGREDEALACCQRGVAANRELGDTLGEGQALDALGRVHAARREWDAAITAFELAIALFARLGDQFRVDRARQGLDEARSAADEEFGSGPTG